jgi:hypothetical protein
MAFRQEVPLAQGVHTAPRYRPLLRSIGAYLDTLEATHLLLAESEEGFIWRCFLRARPDNVLFGVIGHDEVPALEQSVKRSRLGRVPDLYDAPRIPAVCPYGYEELLRCMSYKLDKEAATSMMLIEDDRSVLVQFTLQVPVYIQMEPERMVMPHYFHEDIYARTDIEALVKEIRSFRGNKFYR